MIFRNRTDAGRQLAGALRKYAGEDVVVYALPRGGIIVGREIASALNAPLELTIPRKVGHPSNPEYAVAAVGESGQVVANREEVPDVDADWFQKAVSLELAEAQRRRSLYRGTSKIINSQNKTAIIVDDGIATGLTMRAGILDIKHFQPKKIVVAVPVAPSETSSELRTEVDEVVALEQPAFFAAVGQFYSDFPQVTDDEVIEALKSFK